MCKQVLKEERQERLKKFDLISFIESYEKPEKKTGNNFSTCLTTAKKQ